MQKMLRFLPSGTNRQGTVRCVLIICLNYYNSLLSLLQYVFQLTLDGSKSGFVVTSGQINEHWADINKLDEKIAKLKGFIVKATWVSSLLEHSAISWLIIWL